MLFTMRAIYSGISEFYFMFFCVLCIRCKANVLLVLCRLFCSVFCDSAYPSSFTFISGWYCVGYVPHNGIHSKRHFDFCFLE
jgi:hypothetical protein